MMTAVVVSALVVGAIALIVFPRRIAAQASTLGNMSHSWLAEERAGPQRD